MGVYDKLLAVQSELKAPKGQYNSFGKYKYRSCEDIVEAVKPILSKNRAALLLDDEIVEVGGRFYVKATAQFIDCEDGKGIEVHAFAREDESKKGMDGAQVTGATSSYARKYALNGLLAIDDTKDADATNTHGKDAENTPAIPTTEKYICACCKEEVQDSKKPDGSLWRVKDIVAYSKKYFRGSVYCQKCMRASYDAAKAGDDA